MVEQRAHNPLVVGSIPTERTTFPNMTKQLYKVVTYQASNRRLLQFYHLHDPTMLSKTGGDCSEEEFIAGIYSCLGDVIVSRANVTGSVTFTSKGDHYVHIINRDMHVRN